MFRRILVATHGTAGARLAEEYGIKLARALDAELHALYVIHKGWGSIAGIEWLHASHVRMEFYHYAEAQFRRRAQEVLDAFIARAHALSTMTYVTVGEPGESMAETATAIGADLLIIGPTARVRSEEYQARVSLKKLLKHAPCPVLIANHPSQIITMGKEVMLQPNSQIMKDTENPEALSLSHVE